METEINYAKQEKGCTLAPLEANVLSAPTPERPLAALALDSLAREYGTDKGGQYHGYAEQYGRILEPLRLGGKPKAIVEIGVCRKWEGNRHICPSLAMWRDYWNSLRRSRGCSHSKTAVLPWKLELAWA